MRGVFLMKNQTDRNLGSITATTLIVGIDIAKSVQWARFVDFRGMEHGKALSFKVSKIGFESIVSKINEIRNSNVFRQTFDNVIIGMEPTGHYWKTLAYFLIKRGYKVVGVNPYHTKKSKELDDNSPTKSDKKDALTIARLIKDGRFFNPYMPNDIYAELRALSNARISLLRRNSAIKNTITAILDEYFPEITTVFKYPLNSKSSRQILRSCPFPVEILSFGEQFVFEEIRKAVKRTVGMKRVKALIAAATDSVGVEYGLHATKLRLGYLLDELDVIKKRLADVEESIEKMLNETGCGEQILSVKGIGVVTAAMFLGETGDPMRFDSPRQIERYAGYNLIEDSSGNSKSGTIISKRGRKQFRSVLYLMAYTMVGNNAEMKELYHYLKTRKNNPLKKKQALVVISKKIITIIYNLIKKRVNYNPVLVFGDVRKEMLKAA